MFIQFVLSGTYLAPPPTDAWAAAKGDHLTVETVENGMWHAAAPVTGRMIYDN